MYDPEFTECQEQKKKLLAYLTHTIDLVKGKVGIWIQRIGVATHSRSHLTIIYLLTGKAQTKEAPISGSVLRGVRTWSLLRR